MTAVRAATGRVTFRVDSSFSGGAEFAEDQPTFLLALAHVAAVERVAQALDQTVDVVIVIDTERTRP